MWLQGKQLFDCELWVAAVVTGKGRPFAMMAAQGLDVPWVRSSLSLLVYAVAASASRTGMFVEMSVFNATIAVEIRALSLFGVLKSSM